MHKAMILKERQQKLEFNPITMTGFNWVLGAFQETNKKITDVDYIQPGSSHTNNRWWEADLDRKGKI